MRLFLRVMERRSFTAAAADLDLSRSVATAAVRRLEDRLGTTLLQRSTRHVAPTPDGERFARHCAAILGAIEDAEAAFRPGEVSGLLRVDMHGGMARGFVLPELGGFLARHPALRLHLGEGDRLVDLVREGVDCAIRGGQLPDSELLSRRLGAVQEITCASPDYLAGRGGAPESPDALGGHAMVGFVSSRSGQVMPLEFGGGGANDRPVRVVRLPARVTVATAESELAMARMGMGLAQLPVHRCADALRTGALVEVLRDWRPPPMPIWLLFGRDRQHVPRVRAFSDWLEEAVVPKLRPA